MDEPGCPGCRDALKQIAELPVLRTVSGRPDNLIAEVRALVAKLTRELAEAMRTGNRQAPPRHTGAIAAKRTRIATARWSEQARSTTTTLRSRHYHTEFTRLQLVCKFRALRHGAGTPAVGDCLTATLRAWDNRLLQGHTLPQARSNPPTSARHKFRKLTRERKTL
jgi:hypothetical protein